MAKSKDLPPSILPDQQRRCCQGILDLAGRCIPRLEFLREVEEPADDLEAQVMHLQKVARKAIAFDDEYRRNFTGE